MVLVSGIKGVSCSSREKGLSPAHVKSWCFSMLLVPWDSMDLVCAKTFLHARCRKARPEEGSKYWPSISNSGDPRDGAGSSKDEGFPLPLFISLDIKALKLSLRLLQPLLPSWVSGGWHASEIVEFDTGFCVASGGGVGGRPRTYLLT